jgi:hypothetical protein
MTRDEFIKRRISLYHTIEIANEELKSIEEQFVKENMPYPIGTKVKVTYTNIGGTYIEYGIVTGAELVEVANYVEPIIYMIKKDGTPFKYGKLHLWTDTKVEPLEEQ